MGQPRSGGYRVRVDERGFGPARREAGAIAALIGLCGIAITEPAFALLDRNAQLFAIHGASWIQFVLLALAIALAPALLLYGIEVLCGLIAPRTRRVVHALLCGALVGMFAMQLAKRTTGLAPVPLVAIAVATAVPAAFAFIRYRAARDWSTVLAAAPVVFLAVFLVASPARAIVRSDPQPTNPGLPSVAKPHRVVVVVLDELPLGTLLDGDGRIDRELFPNLAALAARSTWYRNSTANAPYTDFAVPALLTGQYPDERVTDLSAAGHPDSLFTMLDGAYRFNVHETITDLCPRRMCGPTREPERGFGALTRDVATVWRQAASPRRSRAEFHGEVAIRTAPTSMRRFTASLTRADEPTLDFIHAVLPHQPWHLYPDGTDYEAFATPPGALLSWSSQPAADQGRARHLLQTMAADRLVGGVMERLRTIGAWDDSLVVVTADHGVAFRSGEGIRSITGGNWSEIMWTPLFIKYPGQTLPVVDDRPAQTVDLVPTIADVLDARLPGRVDGRSLLATPVADGPRRIYQPAFSFESRDALRAPAGRAYLTYDGPSGFAEVLARRATVFVGGDPSLRPYRIAPYGDLVGRPVDTLLAPRPGGPTRFDVRDAEHFEHVGDRPGRAPWGFVEGAVDGILRPTSLAVALNGRIVATTEAVQFDAEGHGGWSAILEPSAARPGRNTISLYAVSGPLEAPRLDPIRRAA